MLLKEKPVTVKRVRHYFTLTPKVIEDLELAAFSMRLATKRPIRPSHVIEMLITTRAIEKGAAYFREKEEELKKNALRRWVGGTLHGQNKQQYGIMLKPEVYRLILKYRQNLPFEISVSELLELTIRNDGIKKMNEELLKDEQS
jgi:hypothetical protein